MKLMNIVLLFGLINNAYSINQEIKYTFEINFLKIKTLWSYLTPEAKNKLIAFINSDCMTIGQDNADDLATHCKNVDPKILLLLLESEEQSKLSKKQQDEINKIQAKAEKLFSEGFSPQECCNKLFYTIINQNGCEAISHGNFDLKTVIEALILEKELHAIFN